jgi:hypothetical protein
MQHGAVNSSGGSPVPEGKPTLQNILEKIGDLRVTGAELARNLGLSHGQLENRLELLERQGYLKKEEPCRSLPKGCTCRCCQGCSRTTAGNAGGGYTLTGKGRRVAGMKPSAPSPRER